MTRDEMELRFEHLGGVNGKNACLVTIEKYTHTHPGYAGREALWPELIDFTSRHGHYPQLIDFTNRHGHYPQGSNCGCCRMWHLDDTGCRPDCPLNTPELQCDNGDDSPYKQVVHPDHNRVVFDEGCDRIVAACQHWLADHEEDTP